MQTGGEGLHSTCLLHSRRYPKHMAKWGHKDGFPRELHYHRVSVVQCGTLLVAGTPLAILNQGSRFQKSAPVPAYQAWATLPHVCIPTEEQVYYYHSNKLSITVMGYILSDLPSVARELCKSSCQCSSLPHVLNVISGSRESHCYVGYRSLTAWVNLTKFPKFPDLHLLMITDVSITLNLEWLLKEG